MKYYSQINQDEYVLDFYQSKKDGYFVDIGANDGITLSNTKALEDLGWKGICIEPDEKTFDNLKSNRTDNSICVNKAVWNKTEEVIYSAPPDSLIGGIKETLAKNHIQLWSKPDWNFTEHVVQSDTLLRILDECEAPKVIDYLSLDTEGSECDILEHFFKFNAERYSITYIDIEHNHDHETQRRIMKIILENDYRLYRKNRWDWTLVKKDNI